MTKELLGATVWALALLGFYSWLSFTKRQPKYSSGQGFLIVGLIALAVRLVPNLLLPMGAGYDIKSYQIVGDLTLSGEDVYASPEAVDRHPYLPCQMYWMALARWLADTADLSFVKLVRLAPIGADVVITLLIFQQLRHSVGSKAAFRSGLLYALNPISVLVSAYHGQFDAIPSLFLLMAVLMLNRSSLVAGTWLGLGILDKSWPVLALPSLWAAAKRSRERLRLLIGVSFSAVAGVGIYLLLFNGQVRTVLNRALGYNWGIGVWGYTYLFRLLSIVGPGLEGPFAWLVQNGRYLTLAALGLVWLLKAREDPPSSGVLTILVTFLAVTHAFSIQYLMWVVPLAVFGRDHRWLARYTLGAFSYMLLAYTTLILEMHIVNLLPWPQADWFLIMPAGVPAWLVTLGWLKERLSAKRGGGTGIPNASNDRGFLQASKTESAPATMASS